MCTNRLLYNTLKEKRTRFVFHLCAGFQFSFCFYSIEKPNKDKVELEKKQQKILNLNLKKFVQFSIFLFFRCYFFNTTEMKRKPKPCSEPMLSKFSSFDIPHRTYIL